MCSSFLKCGLDLNIDSQARKLFLYTKDFKRELLFHFPSQLKHHQESNFYIDKNDFKTIILNKRESFFSKFQEFGICRNLNTATSGDELK